MKNIFRISGVILVIISIFLIHSCKKDKLTQPVITTTAVIGNSYNTATGGGNITSDGGTAITARGVCWSTASDPTTALSTKTSDGTGVGTFTSSITSLTAGTSYFIRAYATNSAGTGYGAGISFSTTPATVPGVPIIGTASAGNAQAMVTFTVPASNGGAVITGYTITSNPGNITGTGTTSPISLTGLTNGTAYTFTVTATNAIGTSIASSASNSVIPSLPITDIDGNVYNTVTIGKQVWMEENLKTTKYNDGTAIPNITVAATWITATTGAYSDYSNTTANSTTYGRLYNWYAVDNNAATKVASNGGKNVCPTSWHVPSDAEWTTLTTFLGGIQVAGGKLKEKGSTHWITPNIATNETGFTALPGGCRYGPHDYGTYYYIGYNGYWWSSTENSNSLAWNRLMNFYYADVYIGNVNKQSGYSVRCVRDF